jgi:Putative stress-responsive transcriptional regulator
MDATDVRGTLREMWETRPARPRADRQVAGVAAAIARRYDIDPVLVRVGFVVAAVTGIGAALYIALWVALPDEPADPAAPRPHSPRGLMVVGLAIAAAVTIGTVFGGNNGNSVLLSAVVVAALLFLLHLSRGDLGPGRQTTGADAPTVATPTGPSLVKGQPPGEDPLDVTPFVFDLPVRRGLPRHRRRAGSPSPP